MTCITVTVHVDEPTQQEAAAVVRAILAHASTYVVSLTVHPCACDTAMPTDPDIVEAVRARMARRV